MLSIGNKWKKISTATQINDPFFPTEIKPKTDQIREAIIKTEFEPKRFYIKYQNRAVYTVMKLEPDTGPADFKRQRTRILMQNKDFVEAGQASSIFQFDKNEIFLAIDMKYDSDQNYVAFDFLNFKDQNVVNKKTNRFELRHFVVLEDFHQEIEIGQISEFCQKYKIKMKMKGDYMKERLGKSECQGLVQPIWRDFFGEFFWKHICSSWPAERDLFFFIL